MRLGEAPGQAWCCKNATPNQKITTNGEDRNWGVAEMQHPFFCGTTVCVTAAQQDTTSSEEKD